MGFDHFKGWNLAVFCKNVVDILVIENYVEFEEISMNGFLNIKT